MMTLSPIPEPDPATLPGERQNERGLVEALHHQEPYACDDLVQRYARQVYNIAFRLMGHPDEAEEVMQETFINACQAVEKFAGASSLGTWLYRIATNNGLMRLRRKRPPVVSLDTPTEEGETGEALPRELNDWQWEPESLMLSAELRQVMGEAVDSLPDALRATFVLRDLDGLSTEEAAEVLGISVGAAKVRLHRARLLLRERLAAYFGRAGGQA